MDLSVFATFLVVMLCKVDHITSTNTCDDRYPGLLFDNYPGCVLSLPAKTKFRQMSVKVHSKMDCVLVCTREPWCRSVNFKITAERDLRHICELIGTEKYTSHKHLQQDDKFTHLSVKDPCEDKPCLNEGKCLFHDNRLDYRCRCKEGYNGEKCQNNIDECAPGPCQNGATCTDGINDYTCTCAPGWTGKNCQTNIDECAPGPCQNGATCTDGINDYTCTCAPGWTGKNCQTNIDECASGPCQNGATCTDGINDYTCTCAPGWTGKNCQTNINECASNPCLNGGTCSDGVNSYRCSCVAGYVGNNCQTDEDNCAGSPCLNGGTCQDRVNDFSCNCVTGYTGKTCSSDVNECATNPPPCDANAACQNTRGSYQCTCNRGYCGNGKQCTVCALRGLDSSSILSTHGNASYVRTLSGYLYPVLQSSSRSRWIRCWRAATDGWNTATTFHPQCDGKGPTVTIVRVGSYVFGGYSDLSWTTANRYFSSTRSFLYSLYNSHNGYNPVKLTLNGRNNQYGIYCGATHGPTFGGGHDVLIYTNATSNTVSYTNLGYTYNTPSLCSYGTATCYSFLAGSYSFSPNDVEVFYETTN